ncbi:hypothetical protein TanjilG_29897 [Lupinus angustifolius]|uniref:Uncharacterized protein n=1 Tax=Lupinus angustifolius TaxID=3871 RepID=A0A394DMV4_LUPAN|nr:hypothetical protein TanjilG_29897 [Lupinus angustifolius]
MTLGSHIRSNTPNSPIFPDVSQDGVTQLSLGKPLKCLKMTRNQKYDSGQEAVQAKQAPDQTKFVTKLTRSRARWSGQMHQDVGQMHQDVGQKHQGAERVHQSTGRGPNPDRGTKPSLTEAQGPDLIRELGAGPGLTEAHGPDLIRALGARPGLTEA